MFKLFPYIFPFMMEMTLGIAFFVCTNRLAQSGSDAFAVSSVITVWAAAYMIISRILGYFVSEKNAVSMIIASGAMTVITSLCFIYMPGLYMQYFLMILVAVCVSFFFVPFQVFMKEFESDNPRGVAFSTGLYTFSWSLGMSVGPFVSGYLWDSCGWQTSHKVDAVLGFLIIAGFIYLRNYMKRKNQFTASVQHGTETSIQKETAVLSSEYRKAPDLAWLGWIATGVCCFTLAVMRGVFPATAKGLNISSMELGIILAIISLAQGLVALLLCRSRFWFYKALPVSVFASLAILGLLLFAFGRMESLFMLGSLLIGIYSGGFFFYFIFHSLIHPSKSSKYIAINETVVGLTSILGPLTGGCLADNISHRSAYITCALLTLAALIIQAAVHRRQPFPVK